MIIRYIDTHCHLQFDQYSKDRDEIIARMLDEGVAGVVVGTDYESSQQAVALAEKHEHLYAAVGLHPNHAGQEFFSIEKYQELVKHSKVVAIGECGLDYFHSKIGKDVQKDIFRKHTELSVIGDKPIIIHARSNGTDNAYQDLIAILKETKTNHPNLRGVIHFFAGTLEEAEEFIELDFIISFTAVITFARDYDEIIKTVPLKNILSETDSPYVAPVNRRGERNDPLAVIDVVKWIAKIRGEDLETVRKVLIANAQQLFNLPGFGL